MKGNQGALAKALYSNTPSEALNELCFRKGDILTVIEYDYEGQPGWWLCTHRGTRGICPSNYLQLLEDNYYLPNRTHTLQQGSSHSTTGGTSESLEEGGGEFDPIETYDVPRSCMNLSKSSDPLVDESVLYSNQPLYQNDIGDTFLTKTSPLDLYDVPRSQLPIYGNSLSRSRKYGPVSEVSLASHNSFLQNPNISGKSISTSDLGLPPSGHLRTNKRNSPTNNLSITRAASTTISQPANDNSDNIIPVIFRRPKDRQIFHSFPLPTNTPINQSNRSSIQSESAESGIVMVSLPPSQDIYDVPRSSLSAQASSTANNGGESSMSSRPHSSLSATSSGMGISITNSDSKDSLDLYDVPRSAKSYVTHMETKYDQLRSSGESGGGSTSSLSQDSTLTTHSRHNSTSSVFSAYGYSRQGGTNSFKRPTIQPMTSDFGSRTSVASESCPGAGNDLYDVPRSSNCVPPPNPRANRAAPLGASSASLASSRSHTSITSDGSGGNTSGPAGMLEYDIPSSFARKVSLGDSSETLSCAENFRESCGESFIGSSSSSSSRRQSTMENVGGVSGGCAEVKILPLGSKAAVSVSEKLRQEVVTSINSIMGNVKPKWRSKGNLTAIMPDLRFSCIRLSLALKDVAEFATRSISNAKQTGNEGLVAKLHHLLTPVINGSQIVQRDVDELEAYFWSVDRLSVSSGSNNEKNVSGDALDQLILCARSLKHDVTEIANFLALNSSILFRENDQTTAVAVGKSSTEMVESKVENTAEDYDYVSLVSVPENSSRVPSPSLKNEGCEEHKDSKLVELDPRDQQLLEFYSSQIAVTAPMLSQSISTFISSIHQNDPPAVFNVHVKYVILFAFKLLFSGDTIHRNVNNPQLKIEVENKSNDLHKSILALYEQSKVASVEFPKIQPMQNIVDRVWATTQAATQLKKIIFNAATSTA